MITLLIAVLKFLATAFFGFIGVVYVLSWIFLACKKLSGNLKIKLEELVIAALLGPLVLSIVILSNPFKFLRDIKEEIKNANRGS